MKEEDLSMGWWYYRTDDPSTYTICFVMRNQITPGNEWMVWFVDMEGALDLYNLDINNFIKKVPEPT